MDDVPVQQQNAVDFPETQDVPEEETEPEGGSERMINQEESFQGSQLQAMFAHDYAEADLLDLE